MEFPAMKRALIRAATAALTAGILCVGCDEDDTTKSESEDAASTGDDKSDKIPGDPQCTPPVQGECDEGQVFSFQACGCVDIPNCVPPGECDEGQVLVLNTCECIDPPPPQCTPPVQGECDEGQAFSFEACGCVDTPPECIPPEEACAAGELFSAEECACIDLYG
jgi:hypothetical protein